MLALFMAKISLLINFLQRLMVVFKKRALSYKSIILARLKSLIGRIVALSVVVASAVLLSSVAPAHLALAQIQSGPKIQETAVSEIDEASLAHLLSTPLASLDGSESRISDYQDKIIVLNFWASWCPPCVEEMPDLGQIHQDFSSVQVIGYSVDTEANVRRFLDKVPVDFPILIGEPTALRLLRQLGNPSGGLPFSLIFAPDAELRYKIIGQVNTEELRDKLVEMGA